MILPYLAPGFHQIDAVVLGMGAGTPAVRGNAIFVPAGKACLAYDARTLRPLWKRALPYPASRVAVSGGEVVVAGAPNWGKNEARLYGLDAQTGAVRWSVSRQGPASTIAVAGGRLYTVLRPFTLSALDARTHRVLWTAAVSNAKPQGGLLDGAEGVVAEGKTVLVGFASTFYALDAASGRSLWKRKGAARYGGGLATADGVVWAGGAGLDVRTGRPVWQNPALGVPETTGVAAGRFVGIAGGRVRALEPRTGRALWTQPVGEANVYSGGQYVASLGPLIVASGSGRTIGVTPTGAVRWSLPDDVAIARPVWSAGGAFVAFDERRLLRYGPGAEPPLPADPAARRAEAARLVARFEELDAAGVKRLKALKGDAFAPVFAAYRATSAAYDAHDSYPLYSRAHDLADVLQATVDGSRTSDILAALDATPPKGSARPVLMALVARFGDPNVVVPRFLKSMDERTPDFEMYESNTFVARSYIVRSSHPDAVAYMIRALKEPKADPVVREAAYHHLAGTGGEAGRQAVLAERRSRELLPPLAARMDLHDVGRQDRDGKRTTLLAERGEWALVKSRVLGSGGDLWLLHKGAQGWEAPLFVGVSLDGVSRWVKNPGPVPKAFGKTAAELAKGAWFGTLVSGDGRARPELSRDADGDGLTDLEEARLSVDPTKRDTDGDGDPDGVDPWPTVARRALSDEERALAAAFEARHHFMAYSTPAVFGFPKGMRPFEMVGWRGPVVAKTDDGRFSMPLERCYEQGVGFLGVHDVKWNRDRTEARLTLSTYFGGLAGDGYTAVVRRFGDEWLVTSLDQAYVS